MTRWRSHCWWPLGCNCTRLLRRQSLTNVYVDRLSFTSALDKAAVEDLPVEPDAVGQNLRIGPGALDMSRWNAVLRRNNKGLSHILPPQKRRRCFAYVARQHMVKEGNRIVVSREGRDAGMYEGAVIVIGMLIEVQR
jgi:hypothetical protein